MSETAHTPGCETTHDLIPELAMGVAPGDLRSAALDHLAGCAGCRARLRETTAVVDELLLLAPEHEPPPGFETRVLTARRLDGRRPRRRVLLAAAAAVVLAATGGATLARWIDARDAGQASLESHSRSIRTAEMTTIAGSPVGTVFAHEGTPSWLFMTVDGVPSGDYPVHVIRRDGTVVLIGSCWVRDGRGSWGTAISVPVDDISRVELGHASAPSLVAAFAP